MVWAWGEAGGKARRSPFLVSLSTVTRVNTRFPTHSRRYAVLTLFLFLSPRAKAEVFVPVSAPRFVCLSPPMKLNK